ncbi:MAG: MFS transporter [Tepidisphaeraceae bacterium]|jgi:GPH family glycoside/pentoside/hexuronide:cation symporter
MQRSSSQFVSLSGRFAIGVGTLASFLGYTMLYVMAAPVYNMTLKVNAALLGAALFIPRFLDAFIDPMMGKISDNTRSRWGRRRPYIVIGAILMGVIYGIVWMVPAHWSESAKLAYLIVFSLLFFVGYSMFAVPYTSLTYEMTPDYNERTTIMAFCSFFQKVGEFGYQYVFPLAVAFFAPAAAAIMTSQSVTNPTQAAAVMHGVRVVNWVLGVVFMAGIGMLPGLLVKERFQHVAEHQAPVKLLASMRDALRYGPFFVLIVLTILNVLGGMFTSGLDQYVLVYYMFHGNMALGTLWKGFLSTGYAVVGFAAIPAVIWVSKRLGKRRALVAIYGLTCLGGLAKWLDFSPRYPWLIFLDPILCGPIWIAVIVVINSMIADICDEEELRSGQRREGMYGAIFNWVQKLAVSLALLGTGLTLQLSGFDPKLEGSQPTVVLTTMRLFIVGATSVTAVFAMFALRYYTLTAERAQETRRLLEERRKGRAAGLTSPAT